MEFWRSEQLPQVEARRSCQWTSCYRLHTHDRLSLGLIDSGTTVFTGPAGERAAMQAGDVILIPAYHVHACNPHDGRWEYQMIHADQDWLLSQLPPAAVSLTQGVRIFRKAALYAQLSDFSNLLFRDAGLPLLSAALQRIHRSLHGTPPLLLMPASVVPQQSRDPKLSEILQRLGSASDAPALAALAAEYGLSRYQLARAVQRSTGLGPLAWKHNQLILLARTMLVSGKPIAETAALLGFTDQSHFHRVFRQHVAATPGAYRG